MNRENRPLVESWCLLLLSFCATMWLIAPTAGYASPVGEWVRASSPIEQGRFLIPLNDGTVLRFHRRSGEAAGVERYLPETGVWIPNGALESLALPETATMLPSGFILCTGDGIAELYHPASGLSILTGQMQFHRRGHRATILESGKVLVSGGIEGETLIGPAEVYDPLSEVWMLTGVLNNHRRGHAAVRLDDGRILIAGGTGASGALASAEIFDPASETWTAARAMERPRSFADAVVLADNRVLVAGVRSPGVDSELYVPSRDAWEPGATIIDSCGGGRFSSSCGGVTLVMLRDRTPLAAGSGSAATLNLRTGLWEPTGPFAAGTSGAVTGLVVLRDGRALATFAGASGFLSPPGPPSAQLFRPDNTTPRLVAFPLDIDFGVTHPGASMDVTLDIENTGGGVLAGTVAAAAPFSIVSATSFALAAGRSTTILVRFNPPGFGSFSGTVEFISNGNVLDIPVTGGAGVLLSGRVADGDGVGVGGVTISLSGAAGGTTSTDEGGNYKLFVPPNNGYNVAPMRPGLVFSPMVRSVLVGTQNVGGLDFSVSFASAVAQFVAGLYEEILGRSPDHSGFSDWASFLEQGCDANGFSVIAGGFVDSLEFRMSRSLTLTGLVTSLYRGLLRREPEAEGLEGWADVFRRERRTLAVAGFVQSAEFHSIVPDRGDHQAMMALVTRFYTELLGRAPGALEVAGWTNYIAATRDVEGVADAFVASMEFEERALTSREYVTLLYRSILGRDPDPGGLDYWESVLRIHLLEVINEGFILSAEFQARISRICRG